MGASKSLRGRFSHSLDPILPILVSSQECLDISASLSISWTTPCCMVLVSSCRSLSLAHFLPRASDSLLFLSWHILSVYCHFLLDILGYVHWSYSHIFTFFTCHGLSTSFFGQFAWFYFQPDIFITKRWKACFHIHTIFERFAFITLSFFSMELGLKVNQRYFCYRWSIDLMIVLFFTPHSFF